MKSSLEEASRRVRHARKKRSLDGSDDFQVASRGARALINHQYFTMDVVQRLDGKWNDPGQRQRTFAPHERLEIDAVEVLHCVIEDPIGGAPVVVDGDDVWMGEVGGVLHLAL